MKSKSDSEDKDFVGSISEIITALKTRYAKSVKVSCIPSIQTLYAWAKKGMIEPVKVEDMSNEVYRYSQVERLVMDGIYYIQQRAKCHIAKLEEQEDTTA